MLTEINIASALGTVAASVDGSFVTADNAIFATGSSTGAGVLNLGTVQSVVEGFAAEGSIAYDTANNHFYAADGSFLTFAQNGANIALVSQGTTGGTLDLNDAGLSFTPDAGDGTLGVAVTKDGATFNAALDATGTMTLNLSTGIPVITIPKDFSLNLAATTYTGVPIVGNIHGDGVNDVQATLVNGAQIALTSNGTVGANLNHNYYLGDPEKRGDEFIKGYINFLNLVKECNPDSLIICTLGNIKKREIYALVEKAVNIYADEKVVQFKVPDYKIEG